MSRVWRVSRRSSSRAGSKYGGTKSWLGGPASGAISPCSSAAINSWRSRRRRKPHHKPTNPCAAAHGGGLRQHRDLCGPLPLIEQGVILGQDRLEQRTHLRQRIDCAGDPALALDQADQKLAPGLPGGWRSGPNLAARRPSGSDDRPGRAAAPRAAAHCPN